jgi:hypothetical protein
MVILPSQMHNPDSCRTCAASEKKDSVKEARRRNVMDCLNFLCRRLFEMATKNSFETKETKLLTALLHFAEKHGCKVDLDMVNHRIKFLCPNHSSGMSLAQDFQRILKESG